MRDKFRKFMKDGGFLAIFIIPVAIWANWPAIGNPAGFIVKVWYPSRMQCTSLAGPEVTRGCYLAEHQIAVITFKGDDLAYCGIDSATYESFVTSATPDSYFGSSIRDDAVGERYHCGGKPIQHLISG